MRVSKQFDDSRNAKCPICGTAEKKETVLIAILGTQEGNIAEAAQVHLDCLELAYDKEKGIFYQILNKK